MLICPLLAIKFLPSLVYVPLLLHKTVFRFFFFFYLFVNGFFACFHFFIICTDRYFACSLLFYLFVFFHSYCERCFFFHSIIPSLIRVVCPFIIAFLLSYIYVSFLSLSTIISISSFLPSIIPSFIHYRMTFQVRHSTIKYFVLSWKIPCFIGSRVTTLTITVSSS